VHQPFDFFLAELHLDCQIVDVDLPAAAHDIQQPALLVGLCMAGGLPATLHHHKDAKAHQGRHQHHKRDAQAQNRA